MQAPSQNAAGLGYISQKKRVTQIYEVTGSKNMYMPKPISFITNGNEALLLDKRRITKKAIIQFFEIRLLFSIDNC